jgi:hypothetical protein
MNGGLSPEHAGRLKEDFYKEKTLHSEKLGLRLTSKLMASEQIKQIRPKPRLARSSKSSEPRSGNVAIMVLAL